MISLSDLIVKPWELYRKKFKALLPLIGLIFAVAALESILRSFFSADAALSITNFLISLPFFLAALWTTVLAIEFLARTVRGEKLNLKELCAVSLKKLPMAILISVVVGAAVIGGTILLIIPGIIFAVWFNFALYAYILEGKKYLEALKESKILVTGRWFPVFWRLAAINLFWGLVSLAAILGLSWLLRLPFGQLAAGGAPYETLRILLPLLSGAIFSLTTPLVIIGSLMLFMDLRESRSLIPLETQQH
ncbi:MAG: hypothetical protein AAB731_00700 [Patescibacteria group bacterium]